MTGKKKIGIGTIIALQIIVMIYTLSGVMAKFAAAYDFLSFRFILFYGLEILLLGIYAIFWQQNLKRFPVNVAYAHSAVYNIWSLIWAVLIFSETINRGNIIGTFLIIAGILLIRGE